MLILDVFTMEFVRLLYASKVANTYPELKQDLIAILNSAVDFNYRNEITGVLYYGHGYFVQCLEGRRSKVDDLLYTRILKDPRHKNCEILFYEKCNVGLFKNWNMKFAPINKRLGDFFLENHRDDFNPFLLSTETIPNFIDLLASEYAIEPYSFEMNE
jgi:hypothetical protein